jgi:hypothetical protein
VAGQWWHQGRRARVSVVVGTDGDAAGVRDAGFDFDAPLDGGGLGVDGLHRRGRWVRVEERRALADCPLASSPCVRVSHRFDHHFSGWLREVPDLAEPNEFGEARGFLGTAGLVLELDQATRQRVTLLPEGHAVDASDNVVVAHAELDARVHCFDHESTEFTTPHFTGLGRAALGASERVLLGRVEVAHSLVSVDHHRFSILEAFDLEQPALALGGATTLVGGAGRADHNAFIALSHAALLISQQIVEVAQFLGQHFVHASKIRQAGQLLHPAGIGQVHAFAHVVEHGEGEVGFPTLTTHMAGSLVEGGAFDDQLAIEPVGQVRFDPLADEAIGHGFEGAGQRLAIYLQASDAIEFGRGQQGEAQGFKALALAGEHRLGDRGGQGHGIHSNGFRVSSPCGRPPGLVTVPAVVAPF